MDNDEYALDERTLEALSSVMKHKVIDGEVYVAVEGIQGMIQIYAEEVARAAMNGETCLHGVDMGGSILENLDNIMDYCLYVRAGDVVPDIIPDDIMDV